MFTITKSNGVAMKTEDQIEKQTSVYVKMANTLNTAVHNLTLIERRIVMLAISKLETKEYKGNPLFKINALDIAEFAGITPEAAYISAVKASKSLRSRTIPLLCDLVTGEPKKGGTSWVVTSYYNDGEGSIEVSINHELLPYLMAGIDNRYTIYNHSRTGSFRSIYSCRLFDQIMQHKTSGWRAFTVNELADILEVPPSLRSNFANMRNRAIDPAIKEIKKKDGLPIRYTITKTGRKVTGIKFTFPTEQQTDLKLPPKPPKKPPSKKPPKLTPEQLAENAQRAEDAADIVGAIALAKQAGQPLETFIPARLKEAAKPFLQAEKEKAPA